MNELVPKKLNITWYKQNTTYIVSFTSEEVNGSYQCVHIVYKFTFPMSIERHENGSIRLWIYINGIVYQIPDVMI